MTYGARSHSFWLTRKTRNVAVIEQWTRQGKYGATLVSIPASTLTGIAVDPQDDTLWVLRQDFAGTGRQGIENYDRTGRFLGALAIDNFTSDFVAVGAEFAWIRQP